MDNQPNYYVFKVKNGISEQSLWDNNRDGSNLKRAFPTDEIERVGRVVVESSNNIISITD